MSHCKSNCPYATYKEPKEVKAKYNPPKKLNIGNISAIFVGNWRFS